MGRIILSIVTILIALTFWILAQPARHATGSRKVFLPCDTTLEQVLFSPQGTPLVRYRPRREGEQAETHIVDEIEFEHAEAPFRAIKIHETDCEDLRRGKVFDPNE